MAINREYIRRSVYFGKAGPGLSTNTANFNQDNVAGCELVSGPYPQNSPFYNNDVPEPAYNFKEANDQLRAELRRQGYTYNPPPADEEEGFPSYTGPDGQPLTLTLHVKYSGHTNDPLANVALIVRDNLRLVGLDVIIKKLSGRLYDKAVREDKNFDLAVFTYVLPPNGDVTGFFEPGLIGTGSDMTNFMGYRGERMAELIGDFRNPNTKEELTAAGRRIHEELAQDVAALFLFQSYTYLLFSKTVDRPEEGRETPDARRVFRHLPSWKRKPIN